MNKPDIRNGLNHAECPFVFAVKTDEYNMESFYNLDCSSEKCEYFKVTSTQEIDNDIIVEGYCDFENETRNSSLAKKISEELKYLPIYIERD